MEKKRKTDEELLEELKDKRTKCTVWLRVMGYHRPLETFNAGKAGEADERAYFLQPSLPDTVLK